MEQLLKLVTCPFYAVSESKRLALDESVKDLIVRVGGSRAGLRRQCLEIARVCQIPTWKESKAMSIRNWRYCTTESNALIDGLRCLRENALKMVSGPLQCVLDLKLATISCDPQNLELLVVLLHTLFGKFLSVQIGIDFSGGSCELE